MGLHRRFRGASVVLGCAALCFALIATIATVTLNGVLFLIGGAAEIGIGMHARSWGRFFLWVIGGAVYLAVGVICIVDPVFASIVLTLMLGAGLIAAGVVRIFLATGLPAGQPRLPVFVAAAVTIRARFDHCQSLAREQRLCVGNIARRRPVGSWRRLGELWNGTACAELTFLSRREHSRSEQ